MCRPSAVLSPSPLPFIFFLVFTPTVSLARSAWKSSLPIAPSDPSVSSSRNHAPLQPSANGMTLDHKASHEPSNRMTGDYFPSLKMLSYRMLIDRSASHKPIDRTHEDNVPLKKPTSWMAPVKIPLQEATKRIPTEHPIAFSFAKRMLTDLAASVMPTNTGDSDLAGPQTPPVMKPTDLVSTEETPKMVATDLSVPQKSVNDKLITGKDSVNSIPHGQFPYQDPAGGMPPFHSPSQDPAREMPPFHSPSQDPAREMPPFHSPSQDPAREMPPFHSPSQDPAREMPPFHSPSQDPAREMPPFHSPSQDPAREMPPFHSSSQDPARKMPPFHSPSQDPAREMPPSHSPSQDPAREMPPFHSPSQDPARGIPPSHSPSQDPARGMPPFHSPGSMMPPPDTQFRVPAYPAPSGSDVPGQSSQGKNDCNPVKQIFSWKNIVTAAVDELSERMIRYEEFELLDHYCSYFTRPYLIKWRIQILADVWCPGWTTIIGSGFSSKTSESIRLAIQDFIKRAQAEGIVHPDDVQYWYNNNNNNNSNK